MKITYLCFVIGIYKITSPTGKVYIGQSWDIKRRFNDYLSLTSSCKSQIRLYNSLILYGSVVHLFEVVHQLPDDIDQITLTIYEQFYMDCYKDCGIELMNLRDAGNYGKHSPETIEKMSNKTFTEDHRLNISRSKRGPRSVEEKMNRKFKGKTFKKIIRDIKYH